MGPQEIIARRIAGELSSGMLVNLGIGIPTQVANYLPANMHIFFQSENGLIGTGTPPEEGMAHPTLTDAGGRPVSALPGASTFDSAMSFGLIRGGHVDLTVLGGLQVDQQGHLANWMIPGKMVPGMGGAMDLVTGARRVIVRCNTRPRNAEDRREMLAAAYVAASDRHGVTEIAVIEFREGHATLRRLLRGYPSRRSSQRPGSGFRSRPSPGNAAMTTLTATDQSSCSPASYSAIEILRGGRQIEIRALRPSDRDELKAAVARISSASLYRRFFGPKRHFSEKESRIFRECRLRHASRAGGGCRRLRTTHHHRRWPIHYGGARVAELAFAIVDQYQGLGLGAAMLRHLVAIARRAGLRELVASVLPDNRRCSQSSKKAVSISPRDAIGNRAGHAGGAVDVVRATWAVAQRCIRLQQRDRGMPSAAARCIGPESGVTKRRDVATSAANTRSGCGRTTARRAATCVATDPRAAVPPVEKNHQAATLGRERRGELEPAVGRPALVLMPTGEERQIRSTDSPSTRSSCRSRCSAAACSSAPTS